MNELKQTYLDYAASTPVDAVVIDAMMPYFREDFGNSSSIHYFGQRADAAIEKSRMNLADLVGCEADEIIFTSGGTESDNLALRATAYAEKKKRNAKVVLISPVEHHAVAKTAEDLEKNFGFTVKIIPVDTKGKVDLPKLVKLINQDVAIVSVIYGNNEIGTINPVREIGAICHEYGIPFHSDAVQAGGYLPIHFQMDNLDMLSLGGHKFYGPKGVGALIVKKSHKIRAIQTGGAHEFGLRAGTQNTPYIVGMVKAYEITRSKMDFFNKKYKMQIEWLFDSLTKTIKGCRLTGDELSNRLPNHLSMVFDDVDGNQLITVLSQKGFACSSGSACKTGSPEASGVLLAIGIPERLALGSLRITVGRQTTDEDLEAFLIALQDSVMICRGK